VAGDKIGRTTIIPLNQKPLNDVQRQICSNQDESQQKWQTKVTREWRSLKRREKTDEKPINFKEISERPLKSGTQVLLMVPNIKEQQGESDDDSGDWKQREGGASIDGGKQIGAVWF